jgi:branched-chain amino acid transport system permease protein
VDLRTIIGLALTGLPMGGLFALQAMGIVLVYRTTRVFTFAQAGLGLMAAFVTASLAHRLSTPVALVVGILTAVALNLALEQVVRRTDGAIQRTVVTLGALLALQGLAGLMFGAQGDPVQPVGTGSVLDIGSIALTWTRLDVTVLVLVVAIGAALAVFLNRTAIGTAMRAVADDAEAGRLLGLSSGRISSLAWAISGALAGLSGILAAPTVSLNQVSLVVITVQALAATLVGRLDSLPLTVAGGLGLGMLGPVATYEANGQLGTPELAAFVVVVAALLLRRRTGRADVGGAGLPPLPLRPMPTGRGPLVGAGVVLVAGVLLPLLAGNVPSVNRLAAAGAWSVAVLSLVLLAGVVGQVSLCTGTFMGIAAFTAAIAHAHGLTFLLCIPLGALAAAVAAALVALPAARLAPLELAIATISLSFAADRFLFGWKVFVSDANYRPFPPGGIFDDSPAGHGLAGGRALAWLAIVVFVLLGLAVASLRRGRTGAALTALRSSAAATSAMGFSVTTTKLKGFAASGAVAGVAGVLLAGGAGQATGVGSTSGTPYDTTMSITLLAYAVIAGLGSVPGAIIGGLLVELPVYLAAGSSGTSSADQGYYVGLASGLVLIAVVVLSPQGLAGFTGRLLRGRTSARPAVTV